jgi:protein-tyrosine phosphatase
MPGIDVLVLCAEELQRHPHPIVLRAPLDDARPSNDEKRIALRAAFRVNSLRRQGKRVLVTCAQGINRSGLVVALALVLDGVSAADAVRIVRRRRQHPAGAQALSNQHFLRVITETAAQLRGGNARSPSV